MIGLNESHIEMKLEPELRDEFMAVAATGRHLKCSAN